MIERKKNGRGCQVVWGFKEKVHEGPRAIEWNMIGFKNCFAGMFPEGKNNLRVYDAKQGFEEILDAIGEPFRPDGSLETSFLKTEDQIC